MSRWKRKYVMMLAGCVGCAMMGVALGAPVLTGPCNKDDTNTCAFACIASGDPDKWISSADKTQVPYCASTDANKCDPKATYTSCTISWWSDDKCSKGVSPFQTKNQSAGCK
jgi:hypothetical protein